MSEGDSIHRLAKRMNHELDGARVVGSNVRTSRLPNSVLEDFSFVGATARGKHLLMRFESGDKRLTLHSHLQMDGKWLLVEADKSPPITDVRLILNLHDGRSLVATRVPILDLVDTRRESKLVGHLGPDLLADDFDIVDGAMRLARNPNEHIAVALFDQRNVSGLGNVWVNESLFLRGIYPWTAVKNVDGKSLLKLCRKMMVFSTEVQPGMITTGTKRRGETRWVYGRAGQRCRRCGATIETKPSDNTAHGRRICWCPNCQPESRVPTQ